MSHATHIPTHTKITPKRHVMTFQMHVQYHTATVGVRVHLCDPFDILAQSQMLPPPPNPSPPPPQISITPLLNPY